MTERRPVYFRVMSSQKYRLAYSCCICGGSR